MKENIIKTNGEPQKSVLRKNEFAQDLLVTQGTSGLPRTLSKIYVGQGLVLIGYKFYRWMWLAALVYNNGTLCLRGEGMYHPYQL